MKYLKKYENVNKPQIGDYVKVISESLDRYVVEFINNNIGKIKWIDYNNLFVEDEYPILVEFDEKIPVYKEYTITVNMWEIEFLTPEETKNYIFKQNIKKYNL